MGSSGRRASLGCRASATAAPDAALDTPEAGAAPLRVIIAGAGIGGLVLAMGLLKEGFDVQVLERDLTAIRGEGKYRGPIQVQSNALAALEALDREAAERVYAEGCITGDRINGLCDGVTGDWYVKFDTFHPAADKGLPVTRVINRTTLQEILAERVRALGGPGAIINDLAVVDTEEGTDPNSGREQVTAVCADGRRFSGDVLVGADGIWSKVRTKLVGEGAPTYSEYTCYTGISSFTPPDIDVVGYRVFLGNGQYFVSSDVGGGRMQWYGFHREPAGGDDAPGARKERLLQIFGHWSDMVTDLIKATPEEDVLRRDIYDRPPIFKWVQGRTALLGDSAHAMQPNLGQGGCMAIEDAHQLATDLTRAAREATQPGAAPVDVPAVLNAYAGKRVVRAASIHGMARMAAIMASTYKAYLGEGLGPLEGLTALRIPHPGRVTGQAILKLTMPGVLDWVLGGYQGALEQAGGWARTCRLGDQPQGFSEADFPLFLSDDDAVLRAINARWLLLPGAFTATSAAAAHSTEPDDDAGAVMLPTASDAERDAVVLGRGASAAGSVGAGASTVAAAHARVELRGPGQYVIVDGGSQYGTTLNGRRMEPGAEARLLPGDVLRLGLADGGAAFRVKLRHESLVSGSGHGDYARRRDEAGLDGRVAVPTAP